MSYRLDATKEKFELVTVFDRKMLFNCCRIDRKTVPEDMYIYEVRHDDDQQGIPVQIGRWVLVNHWGTLISNEPIELEESSPLKNNAYRDIEIRDWNYEGVSITLQEYMADKQRKEPAVDTSELNSTFSIYQLRRGDETRELRFESLDHLQKAGLSVDKKNYELVYTASFNGCKTLDDIFEKFNIDHPADYRGRSMSVSDVVVISKGNGQKAYYCDSLGFKEIPQFLEDERIKPTEERKDDEKNKKKKRSYER